MKKIRFIPALLLALLLLGLASCSGTKDADALLSTAPADADMAVLLNLREVIKETGVSSKGQKFVVPDQYATLAAQGKGSVLELLQQGGVKLSYVLAFSAKGVTYVTGFVADEQAFRAYVEQATGQKFASRGKLQVCGSVVISGDRFWHSQPGRDVEVSAFMTLDGNKSLAQSGIGKLMLKKIDDKPFYGFASTGNLSQFGANPQAALMLGQMFGDVRYVTFAGDIDDDGLEIDGALLDSRLKPVKDTGFFTRADEKVLASLFGHGDMLVLVGINPKKMSALATLVSPRNTKIVDAFAGTFAVAASVGEMTPRGIPAMSVAATIRPKADTKPLMEMVKSLAAYDADGAILDNMLIINTKPAPESSGASLHLDQLKGAYLGVALSSQAMAQYSQGTVDGWGGAYFKVEPDDGSYELKSKAYTSSREQTLLLLLKSTNLKAL